MNAAAKLLWGSCVVVLIAMCTAVIHGCGAAPYACKTIDLADTLCPLIMVAYVDDAGVKHIEQVPRESIEKPARMATAARLAGSRDAGAGQ